MRFSRAARCFVVLPLLLASKQAAAQTHAASEGSSDRVVAERLFDEGRELMDRGELDAACPKFAESYRMDAALGTLLNLAVCHESQGLLATAWTEYDRAVPLSREKGDARRLEFAEEGKRRLDGRFARLRLELAPELRALTSRRVELDGEALAPEQLEAPHPLEAGRHTVTVTAPGYRSWSAPLLVSSASRELIQLLPALEPLTPATAPKVAPPIAPPPAPPLRSPPRPAQRESAPSSASPRATWGLALGGTGILGLGVGSVFGLLAISEKNARDELCDAGVCSSSRGIDAHRAADRAATVANVAFVAGGALVAGGAILYFTAPSSEATPSAGAKAAHGLGFAASDAAAEVRWEVVW